MRLLLLWLVLAAGLAAQDAPEDAAKKAYLANVNALMVFTSKDGLNSGRYEFTRANATMTILHVPFRYHFATFDPRWNFFAVGGAGYSETQMTTDLNVTRTATEQIKLTTTNMLQTYTGGLGGGLRYHEDNGLELMGGLELIYSRIGISNRDHNRVGDIIEDFFKGQYNDNLSYRFFAYAEYRREVYGFKPYVKLSYELYETKSAISIQELITFTTQSGVTAFAIGGETPAMLSYDRMYLTAEGYLRGSYMGGDIDKVVGFDGFGTLGGVAYWYVPDALKHIKRFFLEVSTIQADGLRGYNIGLGFSLEY